jgi:hypothetical protein
MASTHGGMRRILKRRLPVQRYIELAVKAGSYKSPSTRPNYLGLHDDRNNNKGFMTKREREESMKMRRGIIDYPTEHEILSLNPPLPTPPRTPVRIRKKLLADKRKRAEKLKKERMRRGDDDAETAEIPALDTLVKSYLRRHEDKLRQGMSPSQSRREEEYYSKLLLGQSAAASSSGTTPASQSKFLSPSSLRTAMGRKSMLVENAYAFALRQQQIMLQGDDEKNDMAATAAAMTEQDSIERVEQLLREDARANRQGGRKTAQEIEEWRTETKGGGDDDSTVPSILHDRPRSIRALNIWSSRLQSIPYSRWTIGAATALDHWIAREVLQMDENTWQLILEGGGTDAYVEGMETLPGGETKMGLMDRMRDIVTVRGALFPETLSDGGSVGVRGELAGELDDELSETDKSIDELLASLGSSVDDEDGDLFKFDDDEEETAEGGDNGDANDEQIESIMDELQVWRERNDSSPYESWDNDRKGEFDQWIEKYVATLSPEADGGSVDKDATRIALLSERPMDSNKTKEFWSKVRTETEAELFLEDFRKHAEEKLQSLNESSNQSDEEKQSISELQAILAVPFERQLQKILDIGTLRPVLDEYTSSKERNFFLDKYTPIFLEGLEMEHLVIDENGPIGLDDLSSEMREELSQLWLPGEGHTAGTDQEPRFSIQMIAYGTDEFATTRAERARDLYRLWNEHKASRARFEEAMFKKGYLPVEEDGTRGISKKKEKKAIKK